MHGKTEDKQIKTEIIHKYKIGDYVCVKGFSVKNKLKNEADCLITGLFQHDPFHYQVHHKGSNSYDCIKESQIIRQLDGPTGSDPYEEKSDFEIKKIDLRNPLKNKLKKDNSLDFDGKDKIVIETLKTQFIQEEKINHPKHYTSHPSGVECIEITRHCNFNIGNAIKYLWRCGLKNNEIEDLKKASWYINDEIQKREKEIK